MSYDSQRFAIDEERWRDQIVPQVLREDLVLPRHDDESPMATLELVITAGLHDGVLRTPHGWALHLINDDEPECCGMIVNVRPTDPAEVMLSAGWSEWDNFLSGPDEHAELAAQSVDARLAREAALLHEAIDSVLSLANGLLAATEHRRHAAALGEVILRRLPDGLTDAQLGRFARAFEHSTIGDLVGDCLGLIESVADSPGGGDR